MRGKFLVVLVQHMPLTLASMRPAHCAREVADFAFKSMRSGLLQ